MKAMAHQLFHHFLSSLLSLAALHGVAAVEFDVFHNAGSTPGGIRFDHEIGVPFAKQVMETTTNFVWKLLEENRPEDRRTDVQVVHMIVDDYTGAAAIAYGGACTINVSAVYLQEYEGNDVRWSFTSLMYHEMTHIWQWYPAGTPAGLIEGIADYTTLRANYSSPWFAKPGSGERWDEGYGPTARFLEYCDCLRPGFVAALNRKMRYEWSLNYFAELTGKPVDQLWREYKEKYGGVGGRRRGEKIRKLVEDAGNQREWLWRDEYKARSYAVRSGCQLTNG
ncbi:hypothetical protein U1Q18_041882 [Sarracenia purpurea var. burkii]